jgi:tetratricopeptide (TPR) repeat protein
MSQSSAGVIQPRPKARRILKRVVWLGCIGLVLAGVGVNLWAWRQERLADQLVQRQHYRKAYDHYVQSLAVWRWSAFLHFQAARTARRAGLYPEARNHLDRCQQLQGRDSVPLALENLLLRAQSGDLHEVEKVLWSAIESKQPESPLILEALARGYMRMLRLGTAMHFLERLLEQEPDNLEGLILRAWIKQGGGEPHEAIKDYRHALELDPDRDDARLSLGQALLLDNPEEARGLFASLLSRQPKHLEALLGLAEAERILGRPENAQTLIAEVLARAPGNSKALTEMGTLVLPSGNTSDAETLFRKAIAADQANREAHYQLYLCLIQQPGRKKEAEAQREIHQRVEADQKRLAQIAGTDMARNPKNPDLHYEMGTIYMRYGKPDIGIRWLASALRLDPAHQSSHQALYEYYKRTGNLKLAEHHRVLLRPGNTPKG